MLITSKRHPFDMHIKLGADNNGKLTALALDAVVDNGAYHSIGNVIINRGLHMLSSSYYIPNIRAMAKLVYTNNPWGSAARGAGPPQMHYALECAMDMLAEKLDIDPLEFRLRNSLKPGQTKATGAVVAGMAVPRIVRGREARLRTRQEMMPPHIKRASFGGASGLPPPLSASPCREIRPSPPWNCIPMIVSLFMQRRPIRAREPIPC